MVGGTIVTSWTKNIVLSYMDQRSVAQDGAAVEDEFNWTTSKFESLMYVTPAPSSGAGVSNNSNSHSTDVVCQDSFFDTTLLLGSEWNGKNFWPGVSKVGRPVGWLVLALLACMAYLPCAASQAMPTITIITRRIRQTPLTGSSSASFSFHMDCPKCCKLPTTHTHTAALRPTVRME